MAGQPQQTQSTRITHEWAGQLRTELEKLISANASVTSQKQKIMDMFLLGVSNPLVTESDVTRMNSIIKTAVSLLVESKKLTGKSKLRKPSSAGLTSHLPPVTRDSITRQIVPPLSQRAPLDDAPF